MKEYDITIVGGGILGVALSYMLSTLTDNSILVVEKDDIAYHATSRNSGKIHAPFLYNPREKRLVAKISFLGFDMWRIYATKKNLPFKNDGVLMVACEDREINKLEEYMRWGEDNGLSNNLRILDKCEVRELEPNVRCLKALYCNRDASTNYKILTKELANDAKANGVKFLLNSRLVINDKKVMVNGEYLKTRLLINAAGGSSLDLAHKMGIAKDLHAIYFKGEYWKAPIIYNNLTRISVYSVPKFQEYPFLDPHWLVKVDGSCEVGPNAVLVFGPYAYGIKDNILAFPSKLIDMLRSKLSIDKNFFLFLREEYLSSISKRFMINRVKRFIPMLDSKMFKEKGLPGIRSLIIKDGRFVKEPIVMFHNSSLHIFNYNSPGATGALPFALYVTKLLNKEGMIRFKGTKRSYWDLQTIMQDLE